MSNLEFLIGSHLWMYFSSGRGISDTGVLGDGNGAATGKYAVSTGARIYFEKRVKASTYDSVFFYSGTSDTSFISYETFYNKDFVSVPAGCKYIALRVSLATTVGYDINGNFVNVLYSYNLHYSKLAKKKEKESGQQFFREKLEGKMLAVGSEADKLWATSIETELLLVIVKESSIFYRGTFSKTDCKFDLHKSQCEIKVSPKDRYTDILNQYTDTYDLIKITPAITPIGFYKRMLIQVYIKGATTVSNFIGGTYYETEVTEAKWDETWLTQNYFSLNRTGLEVEVSGAGQSAVNGTYVGTNGYWLHTSGLYAMYADDKHSSSDGTWDSYRVRIRRLSDSAVLYTATTRISVRYDTDIYFSGQLQFMSATSSTDVFTIPAPIQYRVFQRMLCAVDSIDGTATYNIPNDDFAYSGTAYKKCIGLQGGSFYCTGLTVDEPTKYGTNDSGQYFTSNFIPSSAGLGKPLPICRSTWGNASMWYVYDMWYEYYEARLRRKYTLKDAYDISDVITAMLKVIDPKVSHRRVSTFSQFLYADTNPLTNIDLNVFITQKSNMLKGDYDTPAQKAETTFEDLMNMLRDCFKCYWFIDDSNRFRIEHISFFMRGGSYSNQTQVQLDVTSKVDRFNGKQADFAQTQIEYDKSDMAARFEFNWMDNATELFSGLTIDVDSKYVQRDKTDNITVNQFSSDVDFMMLNSSEFSNDGFALLCPIKNGSSYELPIVSVSGVLDDEGDTYRATIQNFYASWLHLYIYYLYDMPAANLECSKFSYVYARGIAKSMKHEITIPYDTDEMMQLVRTSVGDGSILSMDVNAITGQSKIVLSYSPQ